MNKEYWRERSQYFFDFPSEIRPNSLAKLSAKALVLGQVAIRDIPDECRDILLSTVTDEIEESWRFSSDSGDKFRADGDIYAKLLQLCKNLNQRIFISDTNSYFSLVCFPDREIVIEFDGEYPVKLLYKDFFCGIYLCRFHSTSDSCGIFQGETVKIKKHSPFRRINFLILEEEVVWIIPVTEEGRSWLIEGNFYELREYHVMDTKDGYVKYFHTNRAIKRSKKEELEIILFKTIASSWFPSGSL